MLCLQCYQFVYHHGLLGEYPNLRTITRSKTVLKYGEEIIGDLKDLVDDHHLTLIEVGNKYGISRERIRQIFELLYGFKYSVVVSKKIETKKRIAYKERIEKRNPTYKVENYKKNSYTHRGAESEKRVYDICASLNYEIKPFEESGAIDLIINGYKVEIKSAHKTCLTSPGAKTPLFHFARRECQEIADFIICHAVPPNRFFIFPNYIFPKGGHLYLPSVKTREWFSGKSHNVKVSRTSKYYDYEEAWHLLMPKEKDIVFNEVKLVSSSSDTPRS